MIKDKLKSIRLILGVAAAGVLLVAVAAVRAGVRRRMQCGACAPWWHVTTQYAPTNLPPGGEGEITVLAEDLGDDGPERPRRRLEGQAAGGLTAQSVGSSVGTGRPDLADFCETLPEK